MTTVVLDTSVVIRYLVTHPDKLPRSAVKAVITLIETGKIVAYLDAYSWKELQRAFLYDRVQKRLATKSHAKAKQFLPTYKQTCLWHKTTPTVNRSRDSKDNPFLALAQEVHAEYLLTFDEDLLTLKKHGQTVILSPAEFLKITIR